MAPVGYLHGVVALAIGAELRAYVRAHGGRHFGAVTVETGFVVDPQDPPTVRGPDAAVLLVEAVPERGRRGFLPGAPALAVEVKSPYDTDAELEDKAHEYLAAGARLVWLIAPPDEEASRSADRLGGARVWRQGGAGSPPGEPVPLGPDGVLDGEDVLPGFRVPLAELWAEA